MDRIFDRLGDLLRSFIQGDDDDKFRTVGGDRRYADPDMQEAWEELNDFLNDGTESRSERSGTRSGYSGGYSREGGSWSTGRTAPSGPPLEILQDYRTLGLEYGVAADAVKKAHKKLLVKNHPDKFAGSPEKQKAATEMTQRINQAYQRIKRFRETGKI